MRACNKCGAVGMVFKNPMDKWDEPLLKGGEWCECETVKGEERWSPRDKVVSEGVLVLMKGEEPE